MAGIKKLLDSKMLPRDAAEKVYALCVCGFDFAHSLMIYIRVGSFQNSTPLFSKINISLVFGLNTKSINEREEQKRTI